MFENVLLKAVGADEELYLDENGKHIIFRYYRGKVVPMHVDSSDYVDWLADQGIPIDVSSQENMSQAEEILDYLDKVREVAGPDMAAEYEKQIVAAYKDYYQQANQAGYQQALAKRAQSKGISADELQAHYKQIYEQNKDNTIKASSNREGEWEVFIGEYTEKLLYNVPDASVSSNEWGMANAVDLALMTALLKAKKGEAPSSVVLSDILEEELKTREGASRLFSTRYDPKTNQHETGLAALSLIDGVENLLYNIDTGSNFGKQITAAFDKMYARMYNDFDKPNQKKMSPMTNTLNIPEDSKIPEDLPQEFSGQEAQRLMTLYNNQPGSKLGAAHKVMIHTLNRLWEQIPDDKKPQAFMDLSSADSGIHKLHKLYFFRAFQDTASGIREYNPDSLVEESVREALRVKDSVNYNEIVQAIKSVTSNMAHIDGYFAEKANTGGKGHKEIISAWDNSPVLAGRAKSKGEGPNLLQYFADEEVRKDGTLGNDILRIIHKGSVPKASATAEVSNATEAPETSIEVPETPQPTPTSTVGWRQEKNKFIDDATGIEVTMVPQKLPSGTAAIKFLIKTPDGQVHETEAKPSKGKSKDDMLLEAVGEVKNLQLSKGQPAPKVEKKVASKTPKSTTPLPKSSAPGDSESPGLLKLELEISKLLISKGMSKDKSVGSVSVFKDENGNQMYRTVKKGGKVVVQMKVGNKWEEFAFTDLEDAKNNLTKASPVVKNADAGNKAQTSIEAMGDIPPGDSNIIKDALASADNNGLTYKGFSSIGSIRIENKNDKSKGYISISNKGGEVKAHLVTPSGEYEEIPMEQLAQKTAMLL